MPCSTLGKKKSTALPVSQLPGFIRLLLSLEREKNRLGNRGFPYPIKILQLHRNIPQAKPVDCRSSELERFTRFIDKNSLWGRGRNKKGTVLPKKKEHGEIPPITAPAAATKRAGPGWHWTTCQPQAQNRPPAGCGWHWMQKQSPGFLSGARSLRQKGCK
ncbi:hypothetical protein GWK47_044274 [Chionoecetes opilio]|uniref:Uncharacterized protein n=1 Tax=Chionoecetes opilio TaxID=41210 RepID=A0A8J4Y9F6_CHIOP|nr:hypothetical protein GWK47_044274 [Chionoecetes opilio]